MYLILWLAAVSVIYSVIGLLRKPKYGTIRWKIDVEATIKVLTKVDIMPCCKNKLKPVDASLALPFLLLRNCSPFKENSCKKRIQNPLRPCFKYHLICLLFKSGSQPPAFGFCWHPYSGSTDLAPSIFAAIQVQAFVSASVSLTPLYQYPLLVLYSCLLFSLFIDAHMTLCHLLYSYMSSQLSIYSRECFHN